MMIILPVPGDLDREGSSAKESVWKDDSDPNGVRFDV